MTLGLALCVPLIAFCGDEVVRRTAHYEIHVAGSPEEAGEAEVVLEAARKQLEKLFRAEPELEGDARTRVFLLRDRESWLAHIRADGAEPPGGADFVYYLPEKDTIHVYSDGTPYQRRALLLHGATQQFHCQCKQKNRDLVRTWLAMGLADHLSLHTWDGEELRLGALPVVADYDLFAAAEETLQTLDPSLLFEDGLMRGEICMAIVRYVLDHSPKRRKKFDKLALGYTGSKLQASTYVKVLGDPERLAEELVEWLAVHQQPMRRVQGSWMDRGRGQVRADGSLVEALALFKTAPERLTVRLGAEPETGAVGGLVFGVTEGHGRWRATVLPEEILVTGFDLNGDDYQQSFPQPGRPGSPAKLELKREGARITLLGNGKKLLVRQAETPEVGLFAERGVIDFTELAWR